MKQGVWEQFKDKVKNPPPARLAAIEYRSHFMSILGISVVCLVLIIKGFWYVIFAFVFSIGVNYSQGMTAYKKYQMIASITSEIPIEQEISPSRRRNRIIRETFGSSPHWFISTISAVSPVFVIPNNINRISYTLSYLICIVALYVLLYYFPVYWIANPIYQRKIKKSTKLSLKGGSKNAKEENKE